MGLKWEGDEDIEVRTAVVTVRIPKIVCDIIDGLCWTDLAGKRVKTGDISTFIRDFIMRGVREYLKEKNMIEEAKVVEKA